MVKRRPTQGRSTGWTLGQGWRRKLIEGRSRDRRWDLWIRATRHPNRCRWDIETWKRRRNWPQAGRRRSQPRKLLGIAGYNRKNFFHWHVWGAIWDLRIASRTSILVETITITYQYLSQYTCHFCLHVQSRIIVRLLIHCCRTFRKNYKRFCLAYYLQ